MTCPRCETAVLSEKSRDGIVIDVCGTCRGVWLDRGELEKLVAQATREVDELAHRAREVRGRGRHDDRYDRDDDDRARHKKRSVFDALGELFD